MKQQSLKRITDYIIFASLASIVWLIIRIIYSQSTDYIFLLWNLLLAWIPYCLARIIFLQKRIIPSVFHLPLYFFWLIFFPNAPYILTDFIHLFRLADSKFLILFDFILISLFAITGILLALTSLFFVHQKLKETITTNQARAVIIFAITVSSFGIYIGRVLRWNSWDIFLRPLDFLKDVTQAVIRPDQSSILLFTVITFSLFLTLAYQLFNSTLKKLNDQKF